MLFLCGISNYNPVDFQLNPFFAMGINKDRTLNIPISMFRLIDMKRF